MEKLRIFVNDILYVSKKTGTNNKKLLILTSVLLSNLTAAADIGIIVLFTRFFSDEQLMEKDLKKLSIYYYLRSFSTNSYNF